MVLIASPPPPRRPRPLHATLKEGAELYRIYDPSRHGTGPLTFRFVGPLLRLDHHIPGAEDRGIYYAAPTLGGCVVELFGDLGTISLERRRVANPILTRDLTLLDLRHRGAMRAGTVLAVTTADHPISQAWSRYFYEHPEIHGEVHGLIYPNAHNGEAAVALYERAANALICPPDHDWPLDDPVIETVIWEIAHANGLFVES